MSLTVDTKTIIKSVMISGPDDTVTHMYNFYVNRLADEFVADMLKPAPKVFREQSWMAMFRCLALRQPLSNAELMVLENEIPYHYTPESFAHMLEIFPPLAMEMVARGHDRLAIVLLRFVEMAYNREDSQ